MIFTVYHTSTKLSVYENKKDKRAETKNVILSEVSHIQTWKLQINRKDRAVNQQINKSKEMKKKGRFSFKKERKKSINIDYCLCLKTEDCS